MLLRHCCWCEPGLSVSVEAPDREFSSLRRRLQTRYPFNQPRVGSFSLYRDTRERNVIAWTRLIFIDAVLIHLYSPKWLRKNNNTKQTDRQTRLNDLPTPAAMPAWVTRKHRQSYRHADPRRQQQHTAVA